MHEFLAAFGEHCLGPGRLYLVGDATAVLRGFRSSTVDLDFVLDPEPAGAFEAIARLKDELDVSVEISSPAHFVPELRDWREHSPSVGRYGEVEVFDYDLRAQALAKLARGFTRDFADVHSMIDSGATSAAAIAEAFESIRDRILRYPRLDEHALASRVAALSSEGKSS